MRILVIVVTLLWAPLSALADKQLDSKFESIHPTNLHVFPFNRWAERKLEFEEVGKLGIKVSKYDHQPEGYWALVKFSQASDITAYLLRAPSCYGSSYAITLVLYDIRLNKPLSTTTLADTCADAGWEFYVESWLIDLNGDGYLDLVTKRQDEESNSSDPEVPIEQWMDEYSDIATQVYFYVKEQKRFGAAPLDSAKDATVQSLNMRWPSERDWPKKQQKRKVMPNSLFVPTPGTTRHVSCCVLGGSGTTQR